jgi:hypothetical protein
MENSNDKKEKRKEYQRELYLKNKDYYKAKQKEWRKNNPEHLKELKKKSYQRNREKTIKHVKEYRVKNLDKILLYHKKRYADNPDLFKERRLKFKYGISYEDKEKIYLSQEGKCKICFRPFQISELHIDHNHKTNSIRGLLCPHCNTAIGLFREDIKTMNNAIKYLRLGK